MQTAVNWRMTADRSAPDKPPHSWLSALSHGIWRRGRATRPSVTARPVKNQNQQRLEEIGRFLDQHALESTATTLPLVWTYLTRSDDGLVQTFDRRIQSGRPLTVEWLDQLRDPGDNTTESNRLRGLMERLDSNLEEFAKSSREAHGAASSYHSELAGQVSELEQVAMAGAVISEMARIGKVMLRRTREIERQMLRSEAQTRGLKRRLAEARRSSEEDHLTGLPNRRAFEAVFETEYRAASAAGEPLCVGFCDIDHFKRINDEHGHEAGDRVLRLVADTLTQISDDRCHVARHGGEEFVVLLRGASADQALTRLDRVRSELAQRRLINRANDTPFGQVTFSAGVAEVFTHGDPRSALQAADAALYRAKAAGRNRIELAGPQDSERAIAA